MTVGVTVEKTVTLFYLIISVLRAGVRNSRGKFHVFDRWIWFSHEKFRDKNTDKKIWKCQEFFYFKAI